MGSARVPSAWSMAPASMRMEAPSATLTMTPGSMVSAVPLGKVTSRETM